jgi:tRNA A37 threonylcarbamoyladenosine synthetase subunit TsaC/SUA5/YrdC
MNYHIASITHTYPRPFKAQKLWWLWIGEHKQARAYATLDEAKRAAAVLAKLWPGPITVSK